MGATDLETAWNLFFYIILKVKMTNLKEENDGGKSNEIYDMLYLLLIPKMMCDNKIGAGQKRFGFFMVKFGDELGF